MEFVAGRIFRDPSLPNMAAAERAAIFAAMAQVLTRLHALDWKALGLEDFGRTEHFGERQVSDSASCMLECGIYKVLFSSNRQHMQVAVWNKAYQMATAFGARYCY
jgi:aminoglycoside phosphotransferase (APT) family kinase protein